LEEYLLAVDIGTTSAKCLAVTSSGKVLSIQQSFYPTSFPEPGFAEQDPKEIYNGVIAIMKASAIPSSRCLGISFSAAMHSLTAVDENGSLLMPMLIWSDLRSKKQFRQIEKLGLTSKFCALTGTPVHPMSPLCKLLWLKEERPDIFLAADKFLSIKEYVLFRLTGKFVIDYSIASATGLFDLEKLGWSEEVFQLLSLSSEEFSNPVPTTEKIQVSNDLALELGIDKNIPIIVGASDGCLAQLGSGAMEPGDLSITLGTSGAVRVASSKRLIDPDGKIFNYILREGDYICGGATNSGTALLEWFSRNFNLTSEKNLVAFVESVNSIPPGCEGLMMLPYLLGERAPVYNPDSRGVFFGIGVHHTPAHFQRALLEGICLELAWIVETIEKSFGQSKRIFVSGGFTHSPQWVQMLSNVLGRELLLSEHQDASSLGAAMLGFEALGISMKRTKTEMETFRPDMNAHQTYSKLFRIFKELYSQTITLLEDLNKISEA
jgi:gluconokinase